MSGGVKTAGRTETAMRGVLGRGIEATAVTLRYGTAADVGHGGRSGLGRKKKERYGKQGRVRPWMDGYG